MAYVFELGVNCESEDGAVEMINYLDAASGRLDFRLGLGTSMQEGDWWASAVPCHPDTGDALWPSGGPGTKAQAARMTEAGGKLYGLLKAGPHFLHAAVGVEVTSGMTSAELLDSLKREGKGYPGLVLSRPLWAEAGRPPGFTKFIDGYLWVPYEGERFEVR